MTYKGHVQNGVIVLDEPTDLPDGTEVKVLPVNASVSSDEGQATERTWAERLAPFVGCLDGLPSDFAEHHDHYLYGVPKRK
jgi:hypothetical protein